MRLHTAPVTNRSQVRRIFFVAALVVMWNLAHLGPAALVLDIVVNDSPSSFRIHKTTLATVPRLPVIPKPNPFPTLGEVALWMNQTNNMTAGNFLLVFAVVGFSKCGTTTMRKWLGDHPDLQLPIRELYHLSHRTPMELLHELLQITGTNSSQQRGYKCPTNIEKPLAIERLRLHFPATKLLVGLRHPIAMLQSFYNYRVQIGFEDMPPFANLSYRDEIPKARGVHWSRAEYQTSLYRLGKTSGSPQEMELLPEKVAPQPYCPHQVFLYDQQQLSSANPLLALDLSNFLGLDHDNQPLSPVPPHMDPGQRTLEEDMQRERNARKVDICDDAYTEIRRRILANARPTVSWILDYFVPHADVHVSNPEHFAQVLRAYLKDPCDARRRDNIVTTP